MIPTWRPWAPANCKHSRVKQSSDRLKGGVLHVTERCELCRALREVRVRPLYAPKRRRTTYGPWLQPKAFRDRYGRCS